MKANQEFAVVWPLHVEHQLIEPASQDSGMPTLGFQRQISDIVRNTLDYACSASVCANKLQYLCYLSRYFGGVCGRCRKRTNILGQLENLSGRV